MSEPHFLVVRLSSLGDIVHTFPAVAALKETFSSAQITWLTHPRWKFLVETSRLASEVWEMENRSLASIRGAILRVRGLQWDAAIDYQGLWKSAAVPLLGGIRRRIGFSSATIREFGVPILYTDRVTPRTTHIADQNGELSVRAGASNVFAPFRLHIPADDILSIEEALREAAMDRYVVLSPGGGWRSKCWPAERFGALCRRLHNTLVMRCVVNFGPGEEDLAQTIRETSGAANPMLYNGDLGKLMALLSKATCIVGGDTGPLHLAIALDTPAVALYGPTDPARNGPHRSNDIVLRAPGARRSHTRSSKPDPAMLAISVDEVFAALCRRIGAAA